jgi:hypothetical protein
MTKTYFGVIAALVLASAAGVVAQSPAPAAAAAPENGFESSYGEQH